MREGWKFEKLRNLFDITSSKRVFQSEWTNEGVPFYRAREIVKLANNGFVDNELFITEDLYNEYTSKYGKPASGDIMVTGVGTLGICYQVKEDDKFYFKDGNIIWLKKKTENLSEYIRYCFKSEPVVNQVNSGGGATVGTFTIVRANETIIPLPPIDIQKAIVSELDEINSLIALKREQLKKYDELAQSLFFEMFGDPVENEKGWEVKELKEIAIKIGSGATPRGGNDSYKKEGICLIRSMNVHNNRFIYEDLAHIDEIQAKSLSNVEINRQDVLLNITGASVARCCLVPDDVLPARVNQHVCIIRVKKSIVLSIYINRLLTNENYQKTLLSLARSKAATREALPKSIVDHLSIPLPPLSLQQTFAHRIEQIEEQKKQVTAAIAKLETLLASRMQYWFE